MMAFDISSTTIEFVAGMPVKRCVCKHVCRGLTFFELMLLAVDRWPVAWSGNLIEVPGVDVILGKRVTKGTLCC